MKLVEWAVRLLPYLQAAGWLGTGVLVAVFVGKFRQDKRWRPLAPAKSWLQRRTTHVFMERGECKALMSTYADLKRLIGTPWLSLPMGMTKALCARFPNEWQARNTIRLVGENIPLLMPEPEDRKFDAPAPRPPPSALERHGHKFFTEWGYAPPPWGVEFFLWHCQRRAFAYADLAILIEGRLKLDISGACELVEEHLDVHACRKRYSEEQTRAHKKWAEKEKGGKAHAKGAETLRRTGGGAALTSPDDDPKV